MCHFAAKEKQNIASGLSFNHEVRAIHVQVFFSLKDFVSLSAAGEQRDIVDSG